MSSYGSKKNYPFGIALSEGVTSVLEEYKDYLKKEYDLSKKDLAELKGAHLFRLADYFEYSQFDADIVFWSEDKETYYHTGDFEPTVIEKSQVVALVDENNECVTI